MSWVSVDEAFTTVNRAAAVNWTEACDSENNYKGDSTSVTHQEVPAGVAETTVSEVKS